LSAVRSAAAALGGLTLAAACAHPAPLLAMGLLALALAGRRCLVAALTIGLLAGWWQPPTAPPEQDAPVTLSGVLVRPWRSAEDGWIAGLEVRHYRQGRRVVLWRERVTLRLPGPERPAPGRRVRARGLLRRPAGLANDVPLPAGPWQMRFKSRHFLASRDGGAADGWWRLGSAVRRRVEAALAAAGERPGTRLVRALALGDSSRLLPHWRRGLRASGLAHLVALSGLHVGLLAGFCLAVGAPLRRGVGPLLAVAATVLFVLVAGARPALLRAAAMGVLAAGALALERRPHGLALLASLALALALAEPRLLGDLGYQLTCSATAGILWLSPRFEARWAVLPRWLARPLAVTCGAQIASLPWALPAFRLLSPLAPCWNLLAVPWTALALAVSLGWVVAALIWPSAASALAPVLDVAAWPFAAVGGLPPSVLRPVPVAIPFWTALSAAALLAFVLDRPGRRWPLAAAAWLAVRLAAPAPPGLELRMLDVGQGESVLLRDGRRAVLVDGGGWRNGDLGGRVLLPVLARARVRRLDAVVLTHPDLDHCRGLVDLTSYLPVDEVWTAPGWRSRPCADELMTAPGVRLRPLWAGERATVGRWRLLVLHPEPGRRGSGNDRSLVLTATAPGLRLLLTGDVGAAAESRLLRRWPPGSLRADLLKVPHHGSASSTTSGLLAAVRPRLALISCGRGNHYGHPSGRVLERLEAAGTRTLRTDRSGEIVLARAAGGGWRVSTPGLPRPD
jgi:competence protein ComEC